jgi:DNA polymerase III gamma/tau subunit
MSQVWPLHTSSAQKLDAATQNPAHAYIFSGPKGIGTYRIALLFASKLLTGSVVGNIFSFHNANLIVLKPADGKKKISVSQIHELIAQVSQTSFDATKPRVVIIRQAEKLSPDASAALLKTIEEPPGNTIFVLATYNKQALLPTIVSRCTSIALVPPNTEDLVLYVQQHSSATADQATKAVELSGGLTEVAIGLTQPVRLAALQSVQAQAQQFHNGAISEKFAIAKQVYDDANFTIFLERLCFSSPIQSSILVTASNQELILRAEQQFNNNVNPRLILENMALQWSNTSDS